MVRANQRCKTGGFRGTYELQDQPGRRVRFVSKTSLMGRRSSESASSKAADWTGGWRTGGVADWSDLAGTEFATWARLVTLGALEVATIAKSVPNAQNSPNVRPAAGAGQSGRVPGSRARTRGVGFPEPHSHSATLGDPSSRVITTRGSGEPRISDQKGRELGK